jgi:hypothetical protein
MESVYIIYFTVFGDEATGEWKRLHNEELHDAELLTTYCSSDQKKKNEMGERVIHMEEDRCLRDFGGEPEGKRPPGRRRPRW